MAVGPIHAIGRIQPVQGIVVGYFFPELGEVAVEYIGHPVKAGAHIEGEAILDELSGATAGCGIFLEQGNAMACFCQKGCGGQAGETAADYDQVLGGGQGGFFSDGRSALSGVCGRSECGF